MPYAWSALQFFANNAVALLEARCNHFRNKCSPGAHMRCEHFVKHAVACLEARCNHFKIISVSASERIASISEKMLSRIIVDRKADQSRLPNALRSFREKRLSRIIVDRRAGFKFLEADRQASCIVFCKKCAALVLRSAVTILEKMLSRLCPTLEALCNCLRKMLCRFLKLAAIISEKAQSRRSHVLRTFCKTCSRLPRSSLQSIQMLSLVAQLVALVVNRALIWFCEVLENNAVATSPCAWRALHFVGETCCREWSPNLRMIDYTNNEILKNLRFGFDNANTRSYFFQTLVSGGVKHVCEMRGHTSITNVHTNKDILKHLRIGFDIANTCSYFFSKTGSGWCY